MKIKDYMDVKANQYESRIVHKVELPSKDCHGKGLNAWELYGGQVENTMQNDEEQRMRHKVSIEESQGSLYNTKGNTTDFKRIAMESFAKTPCFLKSPRSLASSAHYTRGSLERYHEPDNLPTTMELSKS